jgi:hypothetical protein
VRLQLVLDVKRDWHEKYAFCCVSHPSGPFAHDEYVAWVTHVT